MYHLRTISIFILILEFNCAKISAQKSDSLTIHFNFDKYSISNSDSVILRHFIDTHHNTSDTDSLELFGYCDSIGSVNYNIKLSTMRILSVTSFYANAQSGSNPVKRYKAFGKSNPLNNNADEMERAMNRRVLIVSFLPEKKKVPEMIKEEKIEATIVKPDIFNDSALKVGQNIVLKNLNFIGGRHFPLPGTDSVLERLLDVMKNNLQLKIEIDGYVCCTSERLDGLDFDVHTYTLSVQRAKYVYNYLYENGISKHRMIYKGFGGSNKIYLEEQSELERSANRRIEIKIISK